MADISKYLSGMILTLLNYRDTEVAKKHGHLEQLKVPRLALNLRNGVSLL